jgi:AraC family transcriptional regulator
MIRVPCDQSLAMSPQPITDATDWPRFEPRLRKVVDHVYAHLDEPLDLMTLADIAHLSPHHWHRVYHALCGETMAATVKRLRLHRAAGWLANTGLPVEQVARQSGYPNLQSFTRLFKEVYGLPPARYRAAGQHTEFASLARGERGVAHPVQVRALPALEVVALDHVGPYMQIGQAFDGLFGRVAALGLILPGMRMLGRFFDDPTSVPEEALRAQACVAGCAPGEVAAPLLRTTIPAAECAVLVHTGPYASMGAAYRWLFGEWLEQSGREPADAPVVEEYLNSPRDTAPADLVTHIHLPLRAP